MHPPRHRAAAAGCCCCRRYCCRLRIQAGACSSTGMAAPPLPPPPMPPPGFRRSWPECSLSGPIRLLLRLLRLLRLLLLLLLLLRGHEGHGLPEAAHDRRIVREECRVVEGPATSVSKSQVHTAICTQQLLSRGEGRVLAQHFASAGCFNAGAMPKVHTTHEGHAVPRIFAGLAGESRGRRNHRQRLPRAACASTTAGRGCRTRHDAEVTHRRATRGKQVRWQWWASKLPRRNTRCHHR